MIHDSNNRLLENKWVELIHLEERSLSLHLVVKDAVMVTVFVNLNLLVCGRGLSCGFPDAVSC